MTSAVHIWEVLAWRLAPTPGHSDFFAKNCATENQSFSKNSLCARGADSEALRRGPGRIESRTQVVIRARAYHAWFKYSTGMREQIRWTRGFFPCISVYLGTRVTRARMTKNPRRDCRHLHQSLDVALSRSRWACVSSSPCVAWGKRKHT